MAGAPQRPPQPAGPAGPDRRKGPAAAPADAPAAGGETQAGGRRSAMLPAIVVAVALLAAAFMLKGGGGDSPAAVATTPSSAPAEAEAGNPAHVVSLDPVTLNLSDGSLAKVGIAIEVADVTLLEEIGEEPANFGAKALDELIQLFGERTATDLGGTGKAKIKEELTKRVSEAYRGEVVAVYFTELVIP